MVGGRHAFPVYYIIPLGALGSGGLCLTGILLCRDLQWRWVGSPLYEDCRAANGSNRSMLVGGWFAGWSEELHGSIDREWFCATKLKQALDMVNPGSM